MFLWSIVVSEDHGGFCYLVEKISFTYEKIYRISNTAFKGKVRMPYQISLWSFFFSDSVVGTFIKFV